MVKAVWLAFLNLKSWAWVGSISALSQRTTTWLGGWPGVHRCSPVLLKMAKAAWQCLLCKRASLYPSFATLWHSFVVSRRTAAIPSELTSRKNETITFLRFMSWTSLRMDFDSSLQSHFPRSLNQNIDAFELINRDRYLLKIVLIEIKRLEGDLFLTFRTDRKYKFWRTRTATSVVKWIRKTLALRMRSLSFIVDDPKRWKIRLGCLGPTVRCILQLLKIRWMYRLNFIIIRDLHGTSRREIGNGNRRYFWRMKNEKRDNSIRKRNVDGRQSNFMKKGKWKSYGQEGR